MLTDDELRNSIQGTYDHLTRKMQEQQRPNIFQRATAAVKDISQPTLPMPLPMPDLTTRAGQEIFNTVSPSALRMPGMAVNNPVQVVSPKPESLSEYGPGDAFLVGAGSTFDNAWNGLKYGATSAKRLAAALVGNDNMATEASRDLAAWRERMAEERANYGKLQMEHPGPTMTGEAIGLPQTIGGIWKGKL